ncbi:hypothetical protein A3J20_01765 [Candidatus Gottesmanbacteria bacterium RIFCSPLOWO2_02_FULL_42_29]|uniref:Uncharacterized protein n=2 Tax=Candidatus Gottesmaniibacteriota TaxID=1752720 RepID=A0A1F6BBJ4_9BACT|nr:MAG: Nucleic acid binding protein [Candidatus Gottesmanbacteria bacterium GW2011_GWA2_42_18]KKS74096.1 MAG: Nucleic acid binding protein [Candidatus Gottesmanbacteria bacterium GW2011_GWC2_42_8]OGG10768.1 MAG: hypothetical protein A2781_03860 [Candidatus Gottesmanbacteria bacterium RIFCSPHIGHO2_01_FULL_42_27]OGG21931.1 MAG: hypothetical protein A3E72_01795 [Candidatus Gottesmanbacteria bacterium RIFCSPHIGHO2_12_FULL_43_26]OGG34173.1 MAG: hypothetical protein A2968_03290 [Candidatus Gottesman
MKGFLKYLLSQIVDHPDQIEIEEEQINELSFQYTLKAESTDVGKIIGRDGKIIQAIRNAAKILAVKEGIHVRIQIA